MAHNINGCLAWYVYVVMYTENTLAYYNTTKIYVFSRSKIQEGLYSIPRIL